MSANLSSPPSPSWRQRLTNETIADSKTTESSLQSLSMPLFVKQVLENRGIYSQEAIEFWMNPKLKDLKDPLSMKGMKKAIDRIVLARQQNEKICIYADFDLDGTSGCALLYTAMTELLGFSDVIYYQPKRLSEGYGFHSHAVEDLKEQKVSLIITVDVGITANAACAKARELGIDVIITDHHLAGSELPQAYVIVNPNVDACPSELGYLCGAGVAFYLVMALKREMETLQLLDQKVDLKTLLDFFVIGTLTDMVPLTHDNRSLTKHGLVVFSQTNRPGLSTLLDRLGMSSRDLSGSDVAIRIAPKLNALSRMESGVRPIEILLAKDHLIAQELVDSALMVNDERLLQQQSSLDEALEMIKDHSPSQRFIFLESKSFHRGIIGLIATKLAQDFNLPAFVGSTNADGVIVGSARAPKDYPWSLLEILQTASSSLNRFGGHAAAAGFELSLKNKTLVESAFIDYFAKKQNDGTQVFTEYDTELHLSDMTPQNLRWLDLLGPFGVGFELPVFLFRALSLRSLKQLKGGHVKIQFAQENRGTTAIADGLLFGPQKRHLDLIHHASQNKIHIDALAELQWNYYNGRKTIQLLCRDLREKL